VGSAGGGGLLSGLAPGSRIAGYLLEEQVGAGGMAVVFRAVDERLGRQVALKVLAPALATDEGFRRRFIRESRAAAAVDDPHIVPVYEAGEADGVLFIAMRYVAGGDVHALLRREGPLPPDRVAAIISPVASALDAAHAAGLVHRDVKPTNMLLDVRPERPDHVYLSDFGLSRVLSSSTSLTGLGQFLGTPDYVAPEQIEGKPVGGQADQYALACAAFEMLTGRAPFRRDEANAVIWSHLSVPPPPLATVRPGLPAEADQVFARAMAKAPANRYPRCVDFAESLRQALGLAPYAHRVISAAEPPAADHPATQAVWPAEVDATQESGSGPRLADQADIGAASVGGASSGHVEAESPRGDEAASAERTQTVAVRPAQVVPAMATQAQSDPGYAATQARPAGSDGAATGPMRPAAAGGSGDGPESGAGPAGRRRWLAAGVAVAAVVVLYVVIAAAAHAFPFAKPGHAVAHNTIIQSTLPVTPASSPVTPASSPVSPASSPANAIAPLARLLPSDVPVSTCVSSNPADYHFAIPGAAQALDCQSGNWSVNAFQMDSLSDYGTAWQNFFNWLGIDTSSASTNCPPPGGSSQGIVPWSNKYFPQQNGQELLCWTYISGGSPFPSYAWSFPTEHAFLWASGQVGTSFSALDAWWRANETQTASPSPAAP
jgi:hypothetical protein